MKIKIFQSEMGDCLLVQSGQRNILIDGGMAESYSTHVAKYLDYLRRNNQKLDLVCVSHIDQDHILGILEMMENLVAWRVYDYRKANNGNPRKPATYRPPEIGEVWHNAFHHDKEMNQGRIEDMLATVATIYSFEELSPRLLEVHDVANSQRQALVLSQKLNTEQLNIPLNQSFNGQLAMFRPNQAPVKIGNIEIDLIAPFARDLDKLRDEWNKWLEDSEDTVLGVLRNAKRDAENLGNDIDRLFYPFVTTAKTLGLRSEVTTPNLASIMFVMKEGGKQALMTGDGHHADILKGLKETGYLDNNDAAHFDVLKIQHHGSENNLDLPFCQSITADHYIFCGNGAHHNPDIEVVKTVIKSRLGSASERSNNAQASNSFTLWFNSSSQESVSDKAHMKKVENLIRSEANNHPGKLKSKFMPTGKSYMELTL